MANATNGIFSLIPGALNRASAAPRYTNAIFETIFLDDRPEVGTVGQSINILIPTVNTNNVSLIGSGPVVPHDTAHGNVTLSVTQKQSNTYKLPSFTSALTEVDLAKFYFSPWLEELLRATGKDLTNINVGGSSASPAAPSATNFAANPIIAGSGGHPSRANISAAMAELFAQGCPVDDVDNLFLLTSGGPYYAMTSDQSFSYSYIAGDAGVAAQQKGYLATISNAKILKDQNFPVSGNTSYSMLCHKYAHAARFLVEESEMNKVSYEQFIEPIPGVPVKVEWWRDPFQQGTFCSMSCLYGAAVVRDNYRVLISH